MAKDKDNKNYKQFYETLMNVVEKIVLNYHSDDELQKIISLPDKSIELISYCKKPYLMGSLRPDFLIDVNEEFKMNEINARYAFNGYFLSYYVNKSLSNGGLEDISKIPESFRRIFGNTLFLKDSEPNLDVILYQEYLMEKDLKIQTINSELFLDLKQEDLESVVLELKQREILDNFVKGDIEKLEEYSYLNDIRSIFIAHDKRLLAVLYNNSILDKYANGMEKDILKPHLIETYAINSESDLKEKFIDDKDEWVLKHALKGKSRELYLGTNFDLDSWKKICDNIHDKPFVAQKKINQKEFGVYLPHLGKINMNLFGMFMGVDGKFISQGCYRGKTLDPTMLWNGFLFMPPSIEK